MVDEKWKLHPDFGQDYIVKYNENREEISFIYNHLSIIDTKAGILVGVNSILIAVVGLFLPRWQEVNILESLPFFSLVSWIAAISLFISMMCSLSVITIHWILGSDFCKSKEKYSLKNIQVEIDRIAGRTYRYRISLAFTAIAVIGVSYMMMNGLVSLSLPRADPPVTQEGHQSGAF